MEEDDDDALELDDVLRFLQRPLDDDVSKADAQLRAEIDAFDREYGFVPRGDIPDRHFPELTSRVNISAAFRKESSAHDPVTIDRFELLTGLGEGGYGAVFKARDLELNRLVALKLFSARHPEAEQGVRREARALARLNHSNIIAIHDLGSHDEEQVLYLVTQYVKSVTLRSYAVRARRPWREVLELFLLVGDALAAAHEAGVVHGDFKPDNVIVDEVTMTPYIVDFGLARNLSPDADDFERMGKRGGTLHYRAPELLRGGETSELADLYAFCVSLWQCLDRDPPYVGMDSEELLQDIDVVGDEVRFMHSDAPEQLRAVLVIGLNEAPEERHADMRALLRELELVRGPVLATESVCEPAIEQECVAIEPTSELPPSASKGKGGLGVVCCLLACICIAGVLGELYDSTTQSAPEPTKKELQERAPDERELSEAEFTEARRLLDTGDVRKSFQTWYAAKSRMADIDRPREAEMSFELSRAFSEQFACDNTETKSDGELEDDPCMVASFLGGWMAVDAAESFEHEALWSVASEAREHAAAMFSTGRAPLAAQTQLDCAELNRLAQPCEE